MRYALFAVIWLAPLVAQEPKASTQSLKATFSNVDAEPAPYIPADPAVTNAAQKSQALIYAADQRQVNQAARAVYWANYAANVRDAYNAIQSVLPPVYYPVYIGHPSGRR